MKRKNILLWGLMCMHALVHAAPSFKNKDEAISTFNKLKRELFEKGNIFDYPLATNEWNNAMNRLAVFVESNSKTGGIGSKDAVIMDTLSVIQSANKTLISTIQNTYETYLSKKVKPNLQEAHTYVVDNMIAVRNVLIGQEKNPLLLAVRDKAVLPGKKNAVILLLNMALKLKEIANKVIDDFKEIEQLHSQKAKGAHGVVAQLEDIVLQEVQQEMQQLEMNLKNVPVQKANFQKWLSEVRNLNARIAQVAPAVAKKYDERIAQAAKTHGHTIVIKPSLK